MMQSEISVKVGGRVVKEHVVEVTGTLEEMEETIHALGKRAAAEALQATVEAVELPRPLFRKTKANCVTKAIKVVRSSDSTGR